MVRARLVPQSLIRTHAVALVALATLVVRRAQLWLLDEPHSGLDAASRTDLDQVLLDASRAGATVVVASHDTERVAAIANSTLTLQAGKSVTT